MSTTQDLIAAALTVTGAVRWQYPEISDELRELCARAMAPPDMAEVERLLQVYEYECEDSARAALLDYVRQFAAAPQLSSAADVPMPEPIGRLYFGGVSCGERDEWEFDADQGVCDGINESATEESRQRVYLHRDVRTYGDARAAAGYARGLEVRLSPEKMRIAAAHQLVSTHKIIAPTDPDYAESEAYLRQQTVSTADVPMPEVHDYGYHDSDNGWVETLACDEDDVRTYGVQCRAAGYAAGVAAAQTLQSLRELAAEADAALRGEVKP